MSSVSRLVVSVDELRAVHRFTRLCLPRFVMEDDEEDPRVDAAALRGLAARGLIELCPDDVLVADPLDRLLAPGRAARRIAEIDVEAPGVLDRHAVIDGASGTAVVFTELPGGLVSLRLTVAGLPGEVRRLCRLDEITASASGTEFTITAEAHRHADELVLSGAATAAMEALIAAGVLELAARAWISAVCSRRCAVAVTVARSYRDGTEGPFEVGETRWLVAGDGTAWRVSADEPAEHGDDPSPGDALSVLTPATGDELCAALDLTTTG